MVHIAIIPRPARTTLILGATLGQHDYRAILSVGVRQQYMEAENIAPANQNQVIPQNLMGRWIRLVAQGRTRLDQSRVGNMSVEGKNEYGDVLLPLRCKVRRNAHPNDVDHVTDFMA
jgi:hypothetical protein